MAAHYHPCHPTTPTPPHCHCYYTPSDPYHHHHHPPPPDPHLHHYPPPPPPHQHQPQQIPNLHQYHHTRIQETEFQTNPTTISSLLRRIAALESALLRRTSSSFSSLRDAAARTIQTHFRAFLLRRSRTLRHLKDLASIKSTLALLKSSVSEGTHFDYDVIYRRGVALLLRLDAIQGGDPMIRDGKRAISRDLNRFLEFVGGFRVERRGFSRRVNVRYERSNVRSNSERKVGNLKGGGLRIVNEEKLRDLAARINRLTEELDEEEEEVIESPVIRKRGVYEYKRGGSVGQSSGVHPKVKKSVSFAEEIGITSKDAEEDGEEEEAQSEDGGSSMSSESEKDARSSRRGPEIRKLGVPEARRGGLVKQHDEVQPKVKKTVSFVENGKTYRVLTKNSEPVLIEDLDEKNVRDRLVAARALKDDLRRAVEEIGISSKEAEDDDEEEAHSDEEGSLPSSDGEKDAINHTRSDRNFERRDHDQYENEDFTFSTQLPVKIDTKAGLNEKRAGIAK